MLKRLLLCFTFCGVLAFAAGAALAQGQIYRLEPRKVSDIPNGKAVLINGKAGPNAHRFFLDQVSINTPVVVTLRPMRRGDDIQLSISKLAWENVLRKASTKNGQVSEKFRTEGEFQVSISAAKPDLPYKLVIWVGDEVKPEMAPVVVPKSEYKESGGSWFGGGAVMWVIAAALLGILALLAVIVLRRKS